MQDDDDDWIDIDEKLDNQYIELDARLQKMQERENQEPFKLQVGSVAYGLPTLAATRRTASVLASLRQTEEVNKMLCKIMRQPHDYVKIDPQELVKR